jgi:methionyl-tRNA formyltransferase
MGTPPFAATCLERLLAGQHQIVVVATRADRPSGRGQKISVSPVKALALEHGIEVLQPGSAKDPEFAGRLHEIAPDLAVVVAYGRILPNDVIEAPRLGCINAHASLLPRLRGAAPIERAILQGYDETGVTIMRISERMDAGDTMISRSVPIDTQTDAASLRESLAEVSADLLADAVDLLARGEARFMPQNDDDATYAPPIAKSEAEIDWSADAESVDRAIRAFRPRPGAFTFHDGLRLKILEGSVEHGADDGAPGTIRAEADAAIVCCGSAAIRILTVQPEGKRAMSASDYLRGQGAGKPPVLGRETGA